MIKLNMAEPMLLKKEGSRVEISEETTPGKLYMFFLKGLSFPTVRVHVYKSLPDHIAWPKVTNTCSFT